MRDNGLRAPSYVAIADLAPEVADTMLTVLAGAQVAAYADPCPPVAEPCREIRLPPTPCDRLYVDEEELDRARALLGEQLTKIRDGENTSSAGGPDAPPDEASTDGPVAEAAPSGVGGGEDDHRSDAARMATFDEDRLWAEIVAGYDRVAEDVVPRWPAIEDVEPTSGGDGDDSDDGDDDSGAGGRGAGDGCAGGKDAAADERRKAGRGEPDKTENGKPRSGSTEDGKAGNGKGRDAATEDAELSWPADRRPAEPSPRPAEERFVPPPPPPLPHLDPVTKAAWAAMLGGPVLLLLTVFAGGYLPSWSVAFGTLAFIGGFLTLVMRMKGGPPDDDDGAIV